MNAKRILSLLLTICMMLTIMSFPATAATVDSGTCGDNLTWTLDDYPFATSGICGDNLTWTLDGDGTLTISGRGAMYDYVQCPDFSGSNNFPPWMNGFTRKVVIEQGVTTIGNWAFQWYDSIETVILPDSLIKIGEGAFESCTALTSVTIGDSVTTIGGGAFSGCSYLTSVTIGDSVTTIGDRAFYCCYYLTSVTIPDSVTTIGTRAFSSCSKLTNIAVDAENQYYCSEDGVLFNKDKTTLIQYPADKIATTYTIPDSVTTIGYEAFYYCKSLTSVTIPDSVTTIGDYAFEHCDSLTSVTIGDSVTEIGRYAFYGCTSLTNITIPASVTTIDYDAFYDCDSLKDVYYNGTKVQKDAISIGSSNTPLTSATWHYFDAVCDATCSDCDLVREVGDHTYDNDQDTTCNICGDVREIADPNAPTFVVESKKARVGETFTVAVSTKNNIGIVSLKLKVGYDANMLELVSIEGKDFDSPHFGPLTKNPVTINWEDVLSPNNTTNGAVAVLTFKVKESATEGDTTITITYDPEDVYDENYDNVAFAVEEGIISIIEYIPGDVNGDGTVNNKDLGILRQFLNDWDVTIDERAADVTGDGRVNNKDLGILRQYLNGWDVVLK